MVLRVWIACYGVDDGPVGCGGKDLVFSNLGILGHLPSRNPRLDKKKQKSIAAMGSPSPPWAINIIMIGARINNGLRANLSFPLLLRSARTGV